MTLAYETSYPTVTYEWKCPEGTVFVKIAKENGHIWIDTSVGKAGTSINADAYAISALAGIAIRKGVPPESVIYALKGVSHEGSNPLLARQPDGALSISDAIGKSIEKLFPSGH